MSLELNPNLNRLGLSGGSFGKTKRTGTGISQTTAKNLQSGTAASSTSHYKLGTSRSGVRGQFATKGLNKANYQNLVREHNRNYSPSSSVSSTGSMAYTQSLFGVQQQNSTANFVNSLQVGMQVGKQAYSLLNQLGVIKGSSSSTSTSNSTSLDNAMASLSGNGSVSDNSGFISKMSSCQDSVSLRGAISNAKSELSNMQGMTNYYETSATNAQNSMSTFEKNVDTAEDTLKEAKNNVGTANQTVKGSEQKRDNCLNQLSKADAAYGQKEAAYAQAHDAHETATAKLNTATNAQSRAQTAYDNAKATLDSTPKTITDSNGNQVENPAYQQAKTACEQAKTELDKANQAKEEATKTEQQTKEAETKANQEKEEAYSKLTDTKEDLEQAQTQLDGAIEKQGKAEDAQNVAQEKYQQATTTLESAESAVEQAKVHKKNVERLQSAIKSEESRLTKLEEKEQKQYDKYDKKAQNGIDKNTQRAADLFSGKLGTNRDGGNDADTVDTSRERRLSNKMERTNDKTKQNIARRNAYQSSVDERAFIDDKIRNSAADFKISGQSYRAITTPSGQNLYYRDSEMISEEEYNKMKAGGAGM